MDELKILVENYIASEKKRNKAKQLLIEKMKSLGITKYSISDSEWITYFPSLVVERLRHTTGE